MRSMIALLLGAMALIVSAPSAAVPLVVAESASNDFSNNQGSPSYLGVLGAGRNRISGFAIDTGGLSSDTDAFSFDLPSALTISSATLAFSDFSSPRMDLPTTLLLAFNEQSPTSADGPGVFDAAPFLTPLRNILVLVPQRAVPPCFGTNCLPILINPAFPSYSYTLEIEARSTAIGAVPEPATWGMMIVGFGAAGAMLRRRARVLA